MRIAITGGTGFVGGHLATALVDEGHEVVVVARGVDRRHASVSGPAGITFVRADLTNLGALATAFRDCHAVAHCAGINRQRGRQSYTNVHVRGTELVVRAAASAGVDKLVLLSFLRARPGCGSAYHESKWEAEERIRHSGLDYTIVKAGVVYGQGDHLLDHLSHALLTAPLFATVGVHERPLRPLAVEDLVVVLRAALVDRALSRATVAVVGPEPLRLSVVVRRVAQVVGVRPLVVPLPVAIHYGLAWLFERLMKVPLVSIAQTRILAEGIEEPAGPTSPLPPELTPRRRFTPDQIRRGLPAPAPFGWRDLRCAT